MQTDQPTQPSSSIPEQMPTETPLSLQPTSSQPTPVGKQKKSFPVLKVLTTLVILGLLASLGYFGYQNYTSSKQTPVLTATPQPTPTSTPNSDPKANWTERKFEKFKLTFKAPPDLTIGESELNPNQFTGYIQNDKISEAFFQMSFVYQKAGKKVRESDIQTFKDDARLIIPGTARDVEIEGHPGFAGQMADKKSSFVTAFIKDGYWFIIYTVEPTQTNKELSDQIMATFKFTN